MNIKILDCTLRDGGYVNNWNFSSASTQKFIKNIDIAGIEYAEIGFLKDTEYNTEKTIFNEIKQIHNIIPLGFKHNSKIVAMIVYGNFDINNLIPKNKNIALDAIRVTFKKHEIATVFDYLEKIKNAGYQLFVNPTNIESYSDDELLSLIKKVNNLKPYGFSIVDTNGVLKENDLLRLYYLINHNLDKDTALCFHSHNNLQLSFSNAQCLMKVCQNRELIIDSTVFGMGRGAGNLCTELLTQYINDNFNGNYDIIPILKIVDEQINPIFAQTPWGYSVPYYLAATNHCHPNYAKYLVDKQTVPVEIINKLLQNIPDDKKSIYDSNLIKQIYLDNFSKIVDDSAILKQLNSVLRDKNILLLAPGKTLETEETTINDFISKYKPYVISLNFIPKNYKTDLVFITNAKRFNSLTDINCKLIVTSNIENYPPNAMVLNYSSYLNNSKMYDNVTLMLLILFIKIGIGSVTIAGLDGFSNLQNENYVDENLINNAKLGEFDERNQVISEELSKLNKSININILTNTKYKIQ